MKSKILWIGCICFGSLFASEVPLPDTNFKRNVLPNGLTYYIKKNNFPENRASIRFFVKAGSLHEEDDQQGLAHFLEHMLFRGSDNFQDWEVINYLETIGAQFGPDTNAYTTFSHTCYMLELPLEKEGVLEKGIHICSDWANKATISDELVEKERAVVADELNVSMKSCNSRQSRKLLDKYIGKSRYCQRYPIGLKDVVMNGDPQLIRDFYKKWYRADRIAIVAVGDFDVDEVEAFILKYFSDIEKPTQVLQEPDTSLHLEDDSVFAVFKDSEQTSDVGFLLSVFDNALEEDADTKEISLKGVKKSLFSTVFSRVLNQRLDRKAKEIPSPYVTHFPINTNIDRIGLRGEIFIPFEDRPFQGMNVIMREMGSIFVFGPSSHEFNNVVEVIRNEIKKSLANVNRIPHSTFATSLINNYTDSVPLYKEEDRLNYKLSVLDELTREELIKWLSEENFEPFRHACFQVGDKSKITEEEITATVESWLKEDVVDIEHEALIDFATESKPPVKIGKYTKQFDEELGFTTVVLENGMKIVFQPINLDKKQISFQFVAKGGKNLLSEEMQKSAEFALPYATECGLGNLAGHQFQTFLESKSILFMPALGLNNRMLTVVGTKDNLETILLLSKAFFHNKLTSTGEWNNLIERFVTILKNSANDPYSYFNKQVSKMYHENHPMYAEHKPENAKEEDAIAIAKMLFGDPSQFQLIVSGDINVEEALPLVVSQFSVDNNDSILKPVYFPSSSSPEEKDVTVYRGKNSHCSNYMFYGKDFSYEFKDDMLETANAFDHIITHKLLENLRKEKGDTYGVSVRSSFPFAPNLDQLILVANFACEPEKSENLKDEVRKEFVKFLEVGPSDEEVQTAKEILLERVKVAYQSNYGLQHSHLEALLYNQKPYSLVEYTKLIERQVTKERVCAFAKSAFAKDRSLNAYTIKPESTEE